MQVKSLAGKTTVRPSTDREDKGAEYVIQNWSFN